jgi:hypothetical protein
MGFQTEDYSVSVETILNRLWVDGWSGWLCWYGICLGDVLSGCLLREEEISLIVTKYIRWTPLRRRSMTPIREISREDSNRRPLRWKGSPKKGEGRSRENPHMKNSVVTTGRSLPQAGNRVGGLEYPQRRYLLVFLPPPTPHHLLQPHSGIRLRQGQGKEALKELAGAFEGGRERRRCRRWGVQ